MHNSFPISFNEIFSCLNPIFHGNPNINFDGIETDTRKPLNNKIFIALKGENFDGNKFAKQALEQGASYAIIDDPNESNTPNTILVDDTFKALVQLAKLCRQTVKAKYIGLTGSAGKTSVKELTSALLSANGKNIVSKTIGNWNNQIGLPKSILSINPNAKYAVFETGTNHCGEIKPLAEILQPDSAILTNIGHAHIEFFKTLENTANEKADLLRAVPQDGFAVIHRESDFYEYLSKQCSCKVYSVGFSQQADFQCVKHDIENNSFTVRDVDGHVLEFSFDYDANHQIINALQAIATARLYNISYDDIYTSLKNGVTISMRWEKIYKNNSLWINDCYNANPLSMKKAIDAFCAINPQKQHIAILGDMRELGEQSERFHRELGIQLANSKIDKAILVGSAIQATLDEAVKNGFPSNKIFKCDNSIEARSLANSIIEQDSCVLLKASRGIALEKIINEKSLH